MEEEVTLMAGMANFFSWAYLKRARTSSPTMTPDLRERTDWAIVGGCVVGIGVSKGIAVVESNEMEQWWEYECMNVRGREWWEEEVRVLLCAPPPRLRHSLSFLPQSTKPLHARAPTPTGGAQSFSSAVFGGVQPTGLAFLSCHYRVASGLVGLARSSVDRRRSDEIHILHQFLRQ